MKLYVLYSILMGRLSLQEHILTHHTHKHLVSYLVSIFRCSSSPNNPVYVRRVDFSNFVFSLSSHRHSYFEFIHNKQVDEVIFFNLCGEEGRELLTLSEDHHTDVQIRVRSNPVWKNRRTHRLSHRNLYDDLSRKPWEWQESLYFFVTPSPRDPHHKMYPLTLFFCFIWRRKRGLSGKVGNRCRWYSHTETFFFCLLCNEKNERRTYLWMGVGVEILRLKLEDRMSFTHYRNGNGIKKFESTPGFTGPHSSHTFFPHFTTLSLMCVYYQSKKRLVNNPAPTESL